MSISLIRSEIRSHLIITDEVTEKVGSKIQDGENFKMRFWIQNTFPRRSDGGAYNGREYATYKNIKLTVSGTQFAEVVGGDRTIDVTTGFSNTLPATRLTAVDVEFKAKETFILNWIPEPYVSYKLTADFDYDRYFKVFSTGLEFVQIYPT